VCVSESVSFSRRNDDHFCRFCAIKKMDDEHNMRLCELCYGKMYMTAKLWCRTKTDFLLYTLKQRKMVRLSLMCASHRLNVRATLIFDKCHVKCHRPRVSTLKVLSISEKGSIRNYQLRRLLYGETSSAINFRSER